MPEAPAAHPDGREDPDNQMQNVWTEVRSWDAPVVHALDEVETVEGFAPNQVEWAGFRFYDANSHRRMDHATIWAHPTTDAGLPTSALRFAATGSGFVVTNTDHQELTADDAARVLAVPIDSAERAITTIGSALNDALTEYNTANADERDPAADLEPNAEADIDLGNHLDSEPF